MSTFLPNRSVSNQHAAVARSISLPSGTHLTNSAEGAKAYVPAPNSTPTIHPDELPAAKAYGSSASSGSSGGMGK